MPPSSNCTPTAGAFYFLGLAHRGLDQAAPMFEAFRHALECAPSGLWAAEVEHAPGRAPS